MTIGSGSRVSMSYVLEVTPGVTPGSPSMKTLRTTSRNLNPAIATLASAETRASRQLKDLRHGFKQNGGDIPLELGMQDYDDMLEAALSGTWAAVTTTGSPDMQVIASLSQFVRAAGSNITDGYRPGDYVTTTGFTAGGNNALFLVTAVTATIITVDDLLSVLVDEASASARTLDLEGKRLDIGLTLRTFTFERRFEDINQFQPFLGTCVNSLAISIQPENIVTATIGLLGMDIGVMSGSELGTPAAAADTSPFSAFDGAVYEGASKIAVATGLDLTLNNQRSVEAVVGSQISPDVFEGQTDLTGTLTAFFEDATLYNKFIAETPSSIWNKLDDIDGVNFLNIVMNNIKYTGGDMDPPANGPIHLNLPFTALESSAANGATCISIQRSNA